MVDLNIEQMKEIYNHVNKQQYEMTLPREGRCQRCRQEITPEHKHMMLETEYWDLASIIQRMIKYQYKERCHNHERETYHLRYRCPKDKCYRCGADGHDGRVCNNGLFHWNRLYLCTCDA